VLVNVRATLSSHLAALRYDLQLLGMQEVWVAPEQNLVSGFLPVDKILSLPYQDGYSAVTPVYKPRFRVGAVTTEGDHQIQADLFRAGQGADGTGIKVGVLSDSVNQVTDPNGLTGIASSQSTGDLPPTVQILADDNTPGVTDEGRAMLEIIHDIAPGAQLAFHTADPTPQAFADGIRALAAAGCKVIVDDIGYSNSPRFNDGVIAQAVDDVAAQGVFYCSAAGNEGPGWLDNWTSVTTTVAGINGTFDRLSDGSVLQHFTLPVGSTMDLLVKWDSAYLEGGSPLANFQVQNNVEVLVTNAAGTQVLATFNANALSTDEALQEAFLTNNGQFGGATDFALAYHLTDGPAPGHITWTNFGDDIFAEEEGGPSIFGQPAARGAVAVGAADAQQGALVPESFSSRGGELAFYFDRNGNRLATPDVRLKPEVTAPDNVHTTFFAAQQADGSFLFSGTSAAAPHVAGAVALQVSVEGFETPPAEIIQHLEVTARSLVGPGFEPTFDPQTGFGLIRTWPFHGGHGGSLYPQDRFEPNNSSDQATNFGVLPLNQTQTYNALTISDTPEGLPDYDWFRWSPAAAGTFTATVVTTTTGGSLELHLFTIQGATLVELGSSSDPALTTRSVSVALVAGQTIFVEVHGHNSFVGDIDQGMYNLMVGLS
jgi:hypothetical protein